MSELTWRESAAEVIQETAREWLTGKGKGLTDLPRLTEPEQSLLLKAITAAYPWGERANYPYTAWLLAVKDFKRAFSSPPRVAAGDPLDGLFAPTVPAPAGKGKVG